MHRNMTHSEDLVTTCTVHSFILLLNSRFFPCAAFEKSKAVSESNLFLAKLSVHNMFSSQKKDLQGPNHLILNKFILLNEYNS